MNNILYISHFPHYRMGGQQSMSNLIEHLDQSKYRPFAVVPEKGELSERLEKASCRCFFIPLCSLKPKYYVRFFKNVRLLNKIIKENKIDIVHADHERDAFLASWAIIGTKCKIVWHLRLTRKNNLDNYLANKVHGIIGISKGTIDRIPPKFRDKVRVIYNGVDCELFSPTPDKSALRHTLNLPENQFIILFVGQLKKGKGIFDLLEMANILHDNNKEFLLLYAGKEIDTQVAEDFRNFIIKNELSNYISLLGQKTNIHQYMQASDILILPSHENVEGMGRVLFEAMACGTTPIGTDLPGINEVIDSNSGFLVPPHNPKTLYEKVAFLIDTPPSLIIHNGYSRKRAIELFDIKIHARKVENFYFYLIFSS